MFLWQLVDKINKKYVDRVVPGFFIEGVDVIDGFVEYCCQY